jgi:hypothetical protein
VTAPAVLAAFEAPAVEGAVDDPRDAEAEREALAEEEGAGEKQRVR